MTVDGGPFRRGAISMDGDGTAETWRNQYAAADEARHWTGGRGLIGGENPGGGWQRQRIGDMVTACARNGALGYTVRLRLTPEERAALTPWDSPRLTGRGDGAGGDCGVYGKIKKI